MTQRRARSLVWSLWIVSVVAIVAASVLSAAYPFTSVQEVHDPIGEFVWSASFIGFGLVGALIITQRPDNRIGWVLAGITFTLAITIFGPSYARAAHYNPGAGLPLGPAAAWLASWMFFPGVGLILALLLLFPSGTLTVRRQRVLAAVLLAAVVMLSAVESITYGPIEGDAPPLNPLGIAALTPTLHTVGDVLSWILIGTGLGALADFVYRFVRSRGVQRQQFRWLTLVALAFPVLFLAAITAEDALLTADQFDPVVVVFFLCGNGLAAAIGVAITKHGLYEMNRVVSRSVGYVVLSAVLVAVYLIAVTILTAITAPVTRESPVAVAAATLLAAALFGPARRRIQGVVDRRFNRARYNADVTISAYRGRLRDEVDLAAVSSDLLATVSATMQPAGASLWLAGLHPRLEKFSPPPAAVTVPERHRETKGT